MGDGTVTSMEGLSLLPALAPSIGLKGSGNRGFRSSIRRGKEGDVGDG